MFNLHAQFSVVDDAVGPLCVTAWTERERERELFYSVEHSNNHIRVVATQPANDHSKNDF